MSNLPTKDFATLVREQATVIQGWANALLDFTVGSVLRSVIEANAAIALWIQGLFLQVLAVTRAATSAGADLDSWMADYSMYRLAAVAATGSVTLSRFTATQSATIPVGTIVESSDIVPKQFVIVADTTNAAYSASQNAYIIPSGTVSISVHVASVLSGSGGNVLAGQISVLTSSVIGVDTVANANALTNGVDAETDTALRARFVVFIAGLNKGTKAAVSSAVASVQQGVSYQIVENYNYAGAVQLGFFFVVADDGSGSPSGTFLSNIGAAIDSVRPFTSTFSVYAPVKLNVAVAMTLVTDPAYSHSALTAAVNAALQTYIGSLGVGQSLSYSRMAQIAYDVAPGITNVTSITLNGSQSDIAATQLQIIRPSTITVN